MPLSLRVSVLLISCLTLAPRAVAASEGPSSATSTSAGGAESPRVPPPPTYTPSAVTSADTRPRTADGLLAPDPNKRFAPYEPAVPQPESLTRRGERLMIAGYSLLGAGLTITAVGVTTAFDPFAPAPDPSIPPDYNDDHGYGLFLVTLPTTVLGSAVTLTGAALVGGGYGRWRRGYREWATFGVRADPREPLRANPRRLIIPGAVMLVTAPLVAGVCTALLGSVFILAPGGVAMGTGAGLLTAGLVQRGRRGRAKAQLTPTAGRTRDGTWTGGLVVRW